MRKLAVIAVLAVVVVACESAFAGRFSGRYYANYGGTSYNKSDVVQDKAPVYEVEKRLLERINAERQRYGLLPLVLDPVIHLRARLHCCWMVRHGMIHSGDAGAENIAEGYATIEDAVNGWMNSPGHRANILGAYQRTGVAAYRDEGGHCYWCQQFN